ncbi:hypothetical protein K474DRAFT_55205 [Panus rudis PR-1116 ss-1]|nr:hypothetical protein K474DRAFT_55205 [Panus rudis PR-1116 ss-1]
MRTTTLYILARRMLLWIQLGRASEQQTHLSRRPVRPPVYLPNRAIAFPIAGLTFMVVGPQFASCAMIRDGLASHALCQTRKAIRYGKQVREDITRFEFKYCQRKSSNPQFQYTCKFRDTLSFINTDRSRQLVHYTRTHHAPAVQGSVEWAGIPKRGDSRVSSGFSYEISPVVRVDQPSKLQGRQARGI